MAHGGIFNGPTALGILEQGVFRNAVGLGAVSQPCTFATSWPVGGGEAARAIQTEMKRRGAVNLKVDGYWGNCSESTYQKLFGEPLSKASIEKNFPITCSTFNKAGVFSPSKCTNNTDMISAPPTPEVVPAPPAPPSPPPKVICQEGYVSDPITGGCKLAPPKTTTPTKTTTTAKTPVRPVWPSQTKAASDEWIEGVPNLAIIGVGVGVVLLGLGAFALTRK